MFIGECGNYIILDHMVLLIKRYGCPYIIGTTMLIIQLLFQQYSDPIGSVDTNQKSTLYERTSTIWYLMIAASILFAPLETLWDNYVSYRNEPTRLERTREERCSDTMDILLAVDAVSDQLPQKVLCLADQPKDSMLQCIYYAAPVALVYDTYTDEDLRAPSWQIFAEYYQCTSICFAFENPSWRLLDECRTIEGEQIEPYRIYYVKNNEQGELYLTANANV